MSYRISTSFPVLSALERQVAHALLTRPPLSQSKQASIFSVRLECVMHAASVHPEPGSNSRFKSSILAFFFTVSSKKGIVEFWLLSGSLILFASSSYFLCTSSSLFNFQGSARPSLFWSACLLYHFLPSLSTPFFPFFPFLPFLTKKYCKNSVTTAKINQTH